MARCSTVQVADRLEGARRALAALGRPPESLSVIETTASTWPRAGEPANDSADCRERGARRRRSVPTTCVALGLLQQMTVMGVDVPGELAIVGYDDIEFAGAAAVPLSSVRQPRELLGRTAADLLLAESAAGTDHVHQQVVFRPELVVRASSITQDRTVCFR